MARQGDWQIIDMGRECQVYERNDRQGWSYRGTLRDENAVQTFVRGRGLELVKSGSVGTWPVRVYRKANEG